MVPQVLLAAAVVVVELDFAAKVPGLPELGGRRNEEDQVRDLEQGHRDVEQHQPGNLGLEEAPPIEGHRTVLLNWGKYYKTKMLRVHRHFLNHSCQIKYADDFIHF